jgi:hypothetical protein
MINRIKMGQEIREEGQIRENKNTEKRGDEVKMT